MAIRQEYVSPTLYHFVGRSAGDDLARFDVLMKILESKVLLYDPLGRFPSAVPTFQEDTFRRFGEITMVPAVCFCDIPRSQLSIHTGKYSKFGIGFSKPTLMAKGVRPIWYLPLSATSAIANTETLATRFPVELKRLLHSTGTLIKKLTENTGIADPHNILSNDPELQLALSQLHQSHFFVLAEIAWYFKFFDATLSDADAGNFYFEREWRKVNGNIDFDFGEIENIFVPTEVFKAKLVSRLPHLERMVELM